MLTPSAACISRPGENVATGCQDELALIRDEAARIQNDARQFALSDYRICQDFKSCFEKDCKKTAENTKIFSDLKQASRPFVMFSRTSSPAKGTVVLGHGLGSSPYTMGAIAEKLSQSGYNVVAILLPNHGAHHDRTKLTSPVDFRQVFQNGVQLARALFGSKNLSIGGASTGGLLAVDYLQSHGRAQNEFANLLLFDPAVALGQPWWAPNVEQALAKGAGFKYQLASLAERGLSPWTRSGETNHPSWHGFQARTEARPINEIIEGIRSAPQTIDVPTFAVFSNGFDDQVPLRLPVVDVTRSRKLLFGDGQGTPGLISAIKRKFVRYPSLAHRQVPIRDDLGNCRRYPIAGDNPYFDEMMTSAINFMSENPNADGTSTSNSYGHLNSSGFSKPIN
jgi:pimeloyl-ACP methyl ester carboxylesterase